MCLGSLSSEGAAFLDIYHNSRISGTALNNIIQIVKDPLFNPANLENSIKEILEKHDIDLPPPVCPLFLWYIAF